MQKLRAIIQDAARYQWLRKQPNDTNAPRIDVVRWTQNNDVNEGEGLRLRELDKTIDAEMQKSNGN